MGFSSRHTSSTLCGAERSTSNGVCLFTFAYYSLTEFRKPGLCLARQMKLLASKPAFICGTACGTVVPSSGFPPNAYVQSSRITGSSFIHVDFLTKSLKISGRSIKILTASPVGNALETSAPARARRWLQSPRLSLGAESCAGTF